MDIIFSRPRVFLLFILCFSFSQTNQWIELPNSPEASRFNDIYFLNNNLGWTANGWGQIYFTDDGGSTWALQMEQGETHFRAITFLDDLRGWAGAVGIGEFGSADSNNLYKTVDGGVSWSPYNEFIGPTPGGICGIQKLDFNTVYGVGRVRGPAFFIKTEDGGQNWISYNMSQYSASLIDLYFFNRDTGFVVGATSTEHENSNAIVLRTMDGGQNWETMIITSRFGEKAWKINFPSSSTGYVSLQRNYEAPIYFIKTTDGGEFWEEKLFLEDYYFVQGIGFINDTLGWIGGNSSNPTYVTGDGGETWSSADFGSRVNRFQFFENGEGFSCGRKIYKFTNALEIFSNGNKIIPEYPVINYPNPFNPETTILVYIPESGHVDVSVLDISGRKVRQLFFGDVYEGETWKKIIWNGLNDDHNRMVSGVYFCQVINGSSLFSHRMVLLK
ncbi:MAG: hypothetical protein CMG62_09000 [Candidatus Marinimicrobia bacterium]|nr:hypothetical protein [Candidatus Neomarinimicrobiota bacterium]